MRGRRKDDERGELLAGRDSPEKVCDFWSSETSMMTGSGEKGGGGNRENCSSIQSSFLQPIHHPAKERP
jgi:hypothetical protein